ncbi:MAG: DNA-directed RNA polymerase subunit H [Nanoarchaeota archaeon]|nr:DNA-directed RNA polymerase subunit H [Nanoarchaeota archaeon]
MLYKVFRKLNPIKSPTNLQLKLITDDKNMHILQPKHTKLSEKDSEEILSKLNISKSQLPKILSSDVTLPENCEVGDVIKIERTDPSTEELNAYFRVVV